MTRAKHSADLSLAQLERLMKSRRTEMARLTRQRDKLLKKLGIVNAKLAAISGGSVPGGRAHNSVSLHSAIHQVLSKAGGPIRVGAILEKVLAMGYRSSSANFRGIINQTLIKDKRFVHTARGTYQLKK